MHDQQPNTEDLSNRITTPEPKGSKSLEARVDRLEIEERIDQVTCPAHGVREVRASQGGANEAGSPKGR